MASISKKKNNLNMAYLKKSIEYVGKGTIEYFSESAPTITSTVDEAKFAFRSTKSGISKMNDGVSSYIKDLKSRGGFKRLSDWFLDKENDFDDTGFDGMEFDDGTIISGSEISEANLKSDEKNTVKISRSIIESSHKLVESQIAATANINASIDAQTAVISAGFDNTTKMLGSILDVLTKNTSTIIETSNATAKLLAREKRETNPNDEMLSSGKFNASSYKDMVKKNLEQTDGGMAIALAKAMLDPDLMKSFLTPQNLVSMAIGKGLDKAAPNLKKATEALDNAVNDVIMSSLIRLGESNRFTAGGLLKAFGIDSTRKKADTSRSELGIKSVPYDTISREALTNAIPGYLRKILVAVGGKDEVYDYRSRSFKSVRQIKNEFRDVTSRTDTIRNSTSNIRSKFNIGDEFTNLTFDIMMDNLSSMTGDNGSYGISKHQLQATLQDFSNSEKTYKYLEGLFPKGKLDEARKKKLKSFAKSLASFDGYDISDLKLQAAKQSVERNMRVEKYLANMDDYQMDTSMLKDKDKSDRKHILNKYGYGSNQSTISSKTKSSTITSGVDYTNMALFEIYRRLNKGINVFQTGQSNMRSTPYEDWRERYLKRPSGHKPKTISSKAETANNRTTVHSSNKGPYSNPLENNIDTEGNIENLSRGDRVKRWGKTRGGEFMRAISSGDSDEIRAVMNDMVHDITNTAGKELKKGMSKINDSFGNASGYIKNRLFGSDYSYTDEDGKRVHVKSQAGKNGEKGGLLGFMTDELKQGWKKSSESAKKWMKDIQKDFDYGDDGEDKGIARKRKKLIGMSIGAFAGAGILGGPIGLLAGSIAGSALSTSSIGKNLKEKLFGVDKKTGKATGIFVKIFDKITRPVEYQIKKTINFFAQGLKKHVFGPISDIGYAIKNRVKKTVSSALRKYVLDPLKKGAKKLLGGLLKGAGWLGGKLWEGVTGFKGTETRAKFGAGMQVFDWTASGLAKKIIGDNPEGLEELKRRAKSRKESAAEAAEKFKDPKAFNESKDAERADRLQRLQEYMKVSTEKTEEHTSKIAENSAKIIDILEYKQSGGKNKDRKAQRAEDRTSIHGEVVEEADGTYGKGNITLFNNSKNNDSFKGNALTSITSMGMSGDDISNNEVSLMQNIISKSSKGNTSNADIAKDLNSMIAVQRSQKSKDKDKRESLWSKLLGGLSGIGGSLLSLLKGAGILFLVCKDLQNENGIFKRAMRGLGNLVHGEGSGLTNGSNAALSLIDAKVDNIMDMVNPLADINHSATDGAGNNIKNTAMTKARDQILWRGNLMSAIRGDATRGLTIGGRNMTTGNFSSNFARLRSNTSLGVAGLSEKISNFYDWRSKHTLGSGKKFARKAEKWGNRRDTFLEGAVHQDEIANNPKSGTQNFLNTAGQFAAIAGISKVAGLGTKGITYGLSRITGHDKETASAFSDKASNVAETGTSSLMTANMMSSALTGKESWASKIIDFIGKSLTKLGTFLSKKFPKVGGKIVESCDSMFNALKTKIVGPIVDKIKAKITAVTGKMGLTALSAGTLTVLGGVAGLASGFCGTEHLFGVLPGEADAKMKTISSVMGAAFGALETIPVAGYFVAVLDILDAILAAIPAFKGKGIKQHLASLLYHLISGKKKDQELKRKQAEFSAEREFYNQKFGTELDDGTFNDMMNNTGFFSRIWSGKAKRGEDGHFQYDEDGKLIKSGGIKNIFSRKKKKSKEDKSDSSINEIKSEDGSSTIKKSRSLFGKKIDKNTDENTGDEENKKKLSKSITSLIGKTVDVEKEILKHGGLVGYLASIGTSKLHEKLLSSLKGIQEEDEQQYELDENGKPIEYLTDDKGQSLADDGSKFVKKGDLNSLMMTGMRRLITKIISPLDELREGVDEYNSKDAPWKKDGKGPVAWFKNKLGKIYDGATGWLSSLASANLSPDTSSSTSNTQQATGGVSTSGADASVQQEGGNPLNKDYRITSQYGPRSYPHSGKHKGVDLVPADGSKEADIGSRFSGTVIGVKSNISDDVHAVKEGGSWVFHGSKDQQSGNMVTIQTDDGKIIKNMHIKAGSIPSNIKVGSKVNVGDKLGVMGSTGWSTGPHLHYQIEQGEGNDIDPTTSLSGATIYQFKSSSDTTQEPSSSSTIRPYTSNSSSSTTSNTSESASTTGSSEVSYSGSNPLGALLNALKTAGGKFLSKLTGGLHGSSSNEDSSSSSTTGVASASTSESKHGGGGASRGSSTISSSSSSNDTTPEENYNLTSNPNTEWVAVVRQVKEAVAAKKPSYNQGGSITIDINGRELKVRPDCTGIISAMLKVYGALPESGNVHSSSLLSDGGIPDKFDRAKWPGWDNLIEGDIMSRSGHAEIFAFNDGGKHYVYNGGSTKALAAPGATKSSKTSYDVIWRCREQPSIIAGPKSSSIATVDGASTNSLVSNSEEKHTAVVANADTKTLWDQLKARGYSDYAIAGIMGAWQEESHNKSQTLEGDYFLHPDIEDITSSPDKFSSYATDKLFPGLAKSNIKINKDAYKADDGKYYPGLGLAQWTGPRSKRLLDIARSKNRSWTDHNIQMDYFDTEISERGDIFNTLNSKDSPSSAAEYFTRQFEGCNIDSWVSKRKNNAEQLFNQYGSRDENIPTDGDVAAGGEESTFNYNSRIGSNNFIQRDNTTNSNIQGSSRISGSNIINFGKAKEQIIENRNNADTSEIIKALYQVIGLLEGISVNTGQSSSYLSSMSKLKPAVGGPTTGSSSGSGNMPINTPTPHTPRYSPQSSNGNKMISSMIRP